MQASVRKFLESNGLFCGAALRYIDVSSEIGEVGKKILKATDYGVSSFSPTHSLEEELGDCIFSLLALCCEANVDAKAALEKSLEKYNRRITEKGSPDSGK
jgi:NTP pyrophosphatase (non-canonical NTP hydrolase)